MGLCLEPPRFVTGVARVPSGIFGRGPGCGHLLCAQVARQGGLEALAATIDVYLSPLHCDKPETGCAVAALPEDIARGSLERVARALHGHTQRERTPAASSP